MNRIQIARLIKPCSVTIIWCLVKGKFTAENTECGRRKTADTRFSVVIFPLRFGGYGFRGITQL